MLDRQLEEDERRRLAQHEAMKQQVERDVTDQVVTRASPGPADAGRLNAVAGELRSRAVDETVYTERELDRARTAARGSQVVDYLFWVVYAALGLRFLLELLGANNQAAFAQFVNGISAPFYAPFRGLVPSPTLEGGYTLLLPALVAVLAYALLHAAINGLLRMAAHRKTTV
jgi:YggT family protein